jgi:hypothetical protein
MDIACILSPTARASRRERWERLIAAACLAREPTPDGVRLRFRADPDAVMELHELATAERGVDALNAIFTQGPTRPS